MNDNIKLPSIPKPHTPPVFATAANTPSVKAGYELGGYEKTPPLFDEHQLEAYAREAVRLNAQAQQPLTDEKEALDLLNAENARLTKLVIELRAEVVRLNAQGVPSKKDCEWTNCLHRADDKECAGCPLASAPQPAQPLTDEQANCWCESCDLAKGDPCGRTRMSICPNCGDKRCPRAKHHDNECQQANGIGVKND